MPHSPFVQGGLTADNMPDIAGALCDQPGTWDIRLDTLAFFLAGQQIEDHELRHYAFGSGGASA